MEGSHNAARDLRSFYSQSIAPPEYSRSNAAVRLDSRPRKSGFFSGDGPAYRGDGRDAQFGKHRQSAHEMKPFSSTMPFTITYGPSGKAASATMKAKFAAANPGVSGEGLYMDFIYRSWAQSPDRPLSKVHRSHGLKTMLQCGDVDQISAEVFHFLCGIHQCKYGDGFMRDDMVLCDCDGKVPRCFATVYMELARKVEYLEQKLKKYRAARSSDVHAPNPSHLERPSRLRNSLIMNSANMDNIG